MARRSSRPCLANISFTMEEASTQFGVCFVGLLPMSIVVTRFGYVTRQRQFLLTIYLEPSTPTEGERQHSHP